MPGNKCSNCNTFKTQCTHFYTSKDSSSVLNYKNSREHVAAILSQTTAYVPCTDPTVLYQILVDVAKYARNLEELLAVSPSPSTDLPPHGPFKPEDTRRTNDVRIPPVSEPDIGDDGVFVDSSIVDPLGRLSLRAPSSGTDKNYSFLGKSSSLAFLKKALAHVDDPDSRYKFDAQRQEFWIIQPWEQPVPETVPPQSFPDDDLLATLIDIYFKKINPMIALLHSPSFRASVVDGEHLRDHHFGAVVLAACALAARFSDDPRVLMTENASQQSAGWRYFLQARPRQFGTSPKNVPFRSLYKLQVICLSVLFLGPSSTPRECWILSGFGIRLAQEMGAHLRSRYATSSRYEAELLRRAFWILISADTILSSIFGRPSVTTTEDYDVDLPAECDDEYWDEPYCFQQPANKPALTAYLISYLKLIGIFNRVQRAIYPVTRHKEFEPEVVAELDSALNEWVEHIPSHLRWDQNLEGIFLDQSTSLYVMYYHIQMLIHRPFILAPWTTSLGPSAFPSLSICANSARSCGHVMDVQSKRGGDAVQLPHAIVPFFHLF
ncbi:fungal-specific transcription factor domain-containing protein [Mycena galericulata]|nr:fungal-specific transcription factor domain-containing protein [Mycena galericulata]